MSLDAIPTDELKPPCRGRHAIFESVMGGDHAAAKAICGTCPIPLFAACQRLATEQQWHDGTWAGVLYINGTVDRDGGYKLHPQLVKEHTAEVTTARTAYLADRDVEEGFCERCGTNPRAPQRRICWVCRRAQRKEPA